MDAKEQAQREIVIAEARTWLGTPFRHQAELKGPNGGVDCAHFLTGTYKNAGIVDRVDLAPYMMQWMLHQSGEKFIENISRYMREIPESEALPADSVIYKVGRCFSHGAIITKPWKSEIIHSVNGFGVMYADASREGYLRAITKKAGAMSCRFFTLW